VSRHHAIIRIRGGAVEIKDCESRNGTKVNGRELPANVWIKIFPNDQIDLIDYQFILVEHPSSKRCDGSESIMVPDSSKSWIVSASRSVNSDVDRSESAKVEHWRSVIEVAKSLQDILNTGQVLDRAVESMLSVFPGAERTLIGLLDRNHRFVASAWKLRKGDHPAPNMVSQSVVLHLVENREAICFRDLMVNFPTAESVNALDVRSALCSPLLSLDGEVIGMIQVDASRKQLFDENDLEVLVSVAAMVSMAINFERLHQAAIADALVRRDVENAREVQQSFLPSSTPQVDRYDLASFYRAARHIGGDYYDFIPLADGRLAFALGDVVNKGVPAALKMVRLASETRACLQSLDSPAAILSRLNQRLADDWVTMIIGILDPLSDVIMLSSAGHEYPLLCTHDGLLSEIGKGQECTPLGVDDGAHYFDIGIRLQPGCSLTIFSDGFPDTQGPDGTRFGTTRIQQCVIQNAHLQNASDFIRDLVDNVDQFAANNSQFDDMCIVQLIRKS
jgi:serine phosphatase RsbU (regulator of sigma subunit)